MAFLSWHSTARSLFDSMCLLPSLQIHALAITHRENNSYHARLYFSKVGASHQAVNHH